MFSAKQLELLKDGYNEWLIWVFIISSESSNIFGQPSFPVVMFQYNMIRTKAKDTLGW